MNEVIIWNRAPRPVQFTGVRWVVYIKDRRVCYGQEI